MARLLFFSEREQLARREPWSNSDNGCITATPKLLICNSGAQ